MIKFDDLMNSVKRLRERRLSLKISSIKKRERRAPKESSMSTKELDDLLSSKGIFGEPTEEPNNLEGGN